VETPDDTAVEPVNQFEPVKPVNNGEPVNKPVNNSDSQVETVTSWPDEDIDGERNPEQFNFEPLELVQPADFPVQYVQPSERVEPDTNVPPLSSPFHAEREPGREVKAAMPDNDPEREFKEFKEGVVFALSSGLSAAALKPRIRLMLSRLYQIDWLEFCTSPKAIDQFIPTLDPSEFHHKLKTVAEPGQAERE
jgi:hypothetical protein